MDFVFASNNSAKTKEMAVLAQEMGYSVTNYRDILGKELAFPEETTDSQLENAKAKATFIHQYLPDDWILADDTGLYLQAFPDRFGVTSSREFKSLNVIGKEAEINYILSLYDQGQDRSAYLLAVLAACSPAGQLYTGAGKGGVKIATEARRGDLIGGLDDIMEAENGLTLSEMTMSELVTYHDRARALAQVLQEIKTAE
ncbi:non-canonical purine NTP pyrophosphatase [Fructobacillus cardui]|uniref:All-alpha NTP-PPase family (RdgB) n=1 Tax=Fructobacillus cardui TaxID=2893170 RepID=A0ABN9YS15_9LACO|nr:Inosine/xanthosine triphosphate pyrophosphatase [Fructobacillus cardui]CAK1236071.1 Inosine/xanthosine triphosphate pyrophosphatase [Fructobacillus cardui]